MSIRFGKFLSVQSVQQVVWAAENSGTGALNHGVGQGMRRFAGLPKVGPQAPNRQASGICIANLPGCAIVHLGAIQYGYHKRSGVDRVPATLENVLFGSWPEAGKVGIVEQVARPCHFKIRELAHAVA